MTTQIYKPDKSAHITLLILSALYLTALLWLPVVTTNSQSLPITEIIGSSYPKVATLLVIMLVVHFFEPKKWERIVTGWSLAITICATGASILALVFFEGKMMLMHAYDLRGLPITEAATAGSNAPERQIIDKVAEATDVWATSVTIFIVLMLGMAAAYAGMTEGFDNEDGSQNDDGD